MRVLQVNLGAEVTGIDGVSASVARNVAALRGAGIEVDEIVDGTARLTGLRVLVSRGTQPVVVHFHSMFRPKHVFFAAILTLHKIPFVVSPHSALLREAMKRQRLRKLVFVALFDYWVMRRAFAVLCLTAAEQADVRRRAGTKADLRCIPNPVEASSVQWQDSDRPGRKKIMMLARYDVYQKGLDRLAALAHALPEVDFVVHGLPDKNDPTEVDRLMAAGPPNLVFANPIYGTAKVDALASCDLYVQLSRWEGMSFALLEAMSVGTPCVVSEEVATTVDEPGCTITLPMQVDVAARIVRELLAESSRRSRVGRSAREWVTRHCSPEAVTSALLVVYEEAATSHVVRDGTPKPARADTVRKAHRG